MSPNVFESDHTDAKDQILCERTERWTWVNYLRWSMLLMASALGIAIAAAVGFVVLVVIPIAAIFDIRLIRYAFQIPILVVPVVWTVGMVRCYQRTPSATLMLALAVTGVSFYVALPVILFLITIVTVGGWNAR